MTCNVLLSQTRSPFGIVESVGLKSVTFRFSRELVCNDELPKHDREIPSLLELACLSCLV